MINVPGLNLCFNTLLNTGQKDDIPINPAQSFSETLGSTISGNDVVSRLRSFGVPVVIQNTPKKSKSVGPNGIAIAPNIIKKMEQDEEYAQEIMDEISNFLFNVLPSVKRDYELQGAKLKWYGMSIDSDGQIKSWTGAGLIEDDEEYHGGIELLVFTGNGKKEKDKEVLGDMLVTNFRDDIDWSSYLTLPGTINLKLRHQNE